MAALRESTPELPEQAERRIRDDLGARRPCHSHSGGWRGSHSRARAGSLTAIWRVACCRASPSCAGVQPQIARLIVQRPARTAAVPAPPRPPAQPGQLSNILVRSHWFVRSRSPPAGGTCVLPGHSGRAQGKRRERQGGRAGRRPLGRGCAQRAHPSRISACAGEPRQRTEREF